MKINSLVKMKMVRKICFLFLFVLGLCQTNILGGCLFCKRRKHIKDKNKSILNNIKSKYIFNRIINNMPEGKKLDILKVNKKIQKRSGLSVKDYMKAYILKNYLYNLEITFDKEGIDIEYIIETILNILRGRYHVQRKDDINENNNNIIKDPLYKINGKSILI